MLSVTSWCGLLWWWWPTKIEFTCDATTELACCRSTMVRLNLQCWECWDQQVAASVCAVFGLFCGAGCVRSAHHMYMCTSFYRLCKNLCTCKSMSDMLQAAFYQKHAHIIMQASKQCMLALYRSGAVSLPSQGLVCGYMQRSTAGSGCCPSWGQRCGLML